MAHIPPSGERLQPARGTRWAAGKEQALTRGESPRRSSRRRSAVPTRPPSVRARLRLLGLPSVGCPLGLPEGPFPRPLATTPARRLPRTPHCRYSRQTLLLKVSLRVLRRQSPESQVFPSGARGGHLLRSLSEEGRRLRARARARRKADRERKGRVPGACAVPIKGEGRVTEAPVTAAEETRSGSRARTDGAAGRVQRGPVGTDDGACAAATTEAAAAAAATAAVPGAEGEKAGERSRPPRGA